jgi:hypothetical protein
MHGSREATATISTLICLSHSPFFLRTAAWRLFYRGSRCGTAAQQPLNSRGTPG